MLARTSIKMQGGVPTENVGPSSLLFDGAVNEPRLSRQPAEAYDASDAPPYDRPSFVPVEVPAPMLAATGLQPLFDSSPVVPAKETLIRPAGTRNLVDLTVDRSPRMAKRVPPGAVVETAQSHRGNNTAISVDSPVDRPAPFVPVEQAPPQSPVKLLGLAADPSDAPAAGAAIRSKTSTAAPAASVARRRSLWVAVVAVVIVVVAVIVIARSRHHAS